MKHPWPSILMGVAFLMLYAIFLWAMGDWSYCDECHVTSWRPFFMR